MFEARPRLTSQQAAREAVGQQMRAGALTRENQTSTNTIQEQKNVPRFLADCSFAGLLLSAQAAVATSKNQSKGAVI